METRDHAARPMTAQRALTAAVKWRRVILAAVVLLALAVRMREALVSPVIGAEDPYLHMARTWGLLHGDLPGGYPPGFSILLLPFALLGPEAFYAAARFLPPFLGALEVLGVYLLCRENLRAPAAFVAAIAVALMPENVLRTDLLFPTALDLALLPFFLMHLLRAARGSRRAMAWAGGIALALGIIHPWVLVFMAPPTVTVVLLQLRRSRERTFALGALAALGIGAVLFAFLPGTWNPAPAFFQNAGPRALELLRDPGSLFPLPLYVDSFPGMVTWSVLAFAGVGAVVALVRRTTIGITMLVFSLAIIPFVFVDWFDVWFIPHRSVAYLSLGLAVLAALPVELMGALPEWERADIAAAGVIGIYLVAALTPGAFATGPWYRLYDEQDYDAWHAVADRDPSLVITGSWQGSAGYTAITGERSTFNPQFFRDGGTRAQALDEHPDLIVLIDQYARADGLRAPGGWKAIGQWGDTRAYAPP